MMKWGWGCSYPLEIILFRASVLPLHAAQCIAVHPSSSFLFRSFLADFFSTAMFPSLAAWCVANTVGVSDITRSQFNCSCYLQVLCFSQTRVGRMTGCNSSISNRGTAKTPRYTSHNYLWPNPLKFQWTIDKHVKSNSRHTSFTVYVFNSNFQYFWLNIW